MNKLKLIIGREYLTKVKTKSFILVTLLVPFSIFAFMGVTAFLGSYKTSTQSKYIMIDSSRILDEDFSIKGANLEFRDNDVQSEIKEFDEEKYKGLIVLAPIDSLSSEAQLTIYSDKTIPISITSSLSRKIKSIVEKQKLVQLNLSEERYNALKVNIKLTQEGIKEKDNKKSSLLSGAALGLGVFMGFLMYLFIFLYGTMVMKSVMEEKTNRIAEVIISSVSPFQLMLGKIIGVGLVALTQILIWSIMIFGIQTIMVSMFGMNIEAQELSNIPQGDASKIAELLNVIGSINWLLILPMFVVYFIGGYLLYASFFAAVASAVGDASGGDQQTMTLPISIPIIMGMMLMMPAVEAPDSTLAMASSIFPLFSPIVMPALLPFEPSVWQLVISVILLYGSAFFFIWLAGRIYRVGIMLYGKKVKMGEMLKWIFISKI